MSEQITGYDRTASNIEMDWPTGKYRTVVIDPPWPANGYPGRTFVAKPWDGCCEHNRRGRDPSGHWCGSVLSNKKFGYELMSLDELADLDVAGLLEEDAFVFLWTINKFVRDAFDLLDAWGLRYMCMMAWHKPHGPKPAGYPIYNMEQILVGKTGRPIFTDTKNFRIANLWDAPRNHDAAPGAWGRQIVNCSKPEGFYDLLRRVTPAPRIDLFARRQIEDFDVWGDQVPAIEPRLL